MNSAQIHLALTHVPVILSLTGLAMLIISLMKRSNSLVKTSYCVLLIAGIIVIPVYLSGESTEDLIESLPCVSETAIERHEEMAKLTMISIVAAGLMALTGLFLFQRRIARIVKLLVLLLAISSGGLMAQTAHLGGQIRHTEIRNGFIVSTGEQGTDNAESTYDQSKEDND